MSETDKPAPRHLTGYELVIATPTSLAVAPANLLVWVPTDEEGEAGWFAGGINLEGRAVPWWDLPSCIGVKRACERIGTWQRAINARDGRPDDPR